MKLAERLKEQGRVEGRVQGRLELLAVFGLHVLKDKFGKIPDNYYQQIQKADVSTLHSLCLRIPQAKSLKELFKPEQAEH